MGHLSEPAKGILSIFFLGPGEGEDALRGLFNLYLLGMYIALAFLVGYISCCRRR